MANDSGYVEYDPNVTKGVRAKDALTSTIAGAGQWSKYGLPGMAIGALFGLGKSVSGGGGDIAFNKAKEEEQQRVMQENQLITGTREAENISGLVGSPWEVTGTRSSRMSPIPGNINPENTPASQYEQMLKFHNISGVDTLG